MKMKDRLLKRKSWLLGIVCLALLVSFLYAFNPDRKITLTFGMCTGSSWDVPNGNAYQVIDKAIALFEKQHPNVTVKYESGISKDDYASWLSEKIISGTQPDVFMVPSDDFNTLSSTGALKDLDRYFDEDHLDRSLYYASCFEAGTYGETQYALPYESNPTMMCVNRDLLKKEGIEIPSGGWTLDTFYKICAKVTKDTNGDGVIDQYGCTGYTWQEALSAFGIKLFNDSGTTAYFNTSKVKKALAMVSKINALSGNYNVSSNDFDKGKVAFSPLTLAEYRTYQPYPYRVSKYSTFSWGCVEMPGTSTNIKTTSLTTLLLAISSKSDQPSLAWEFLKMLSSNETIQQELFANSQGVSVLKSVMASKKTQSILEDDDFGSASLNQSTLNTILTHTVTIPKFRKYNAAMEKADYLITSSISLGTLENDLADIQRQISETLK